MQKVTTKQQPTQRPALVAPRIRGYRIVIYRGYGSGPSQHLPIIFAQGIPAQWNEVQADASVTQAILIRSGRKYRTFARQGGNG